MEIQNDQRNLLGILSECQPIIFNFWVMKKLKLMTKNEIGQPNGQTVKLMVLDAIWFLIESLIMWISS